MKPVEEAWVEAVAAAAGAAAEVTGCWMSEAVMLSSCDGVASGAIADMF